jgi:hypothetical protein
METTLTPEKRKIAERMYRKGVVTVDRIGPKMTSNTASPAEKSEYDKAIANIEKLWLQYGGTTGPPPVGSDTPQPVPAPIDPVETAKQEKIQAFRNFRAAGEPKRIHSKLLNETIVLVCSEQQRTDMDNLGTVEEPIFTVDEVIFLIKNDFSLDQIHKVRDLMVLFDGQLVKRRK